jgi:DNA polymerase-4
VGIGQNKLQAKLATGFGKPAGVFRLTDQNWFEVLGDRPTDALWGIGAKTAQKLAALGLHTVRELAAAEPDALAAAFGPTTGPWLILLALGRGEKTVDDTPYRARSHGREVTYQQDIEDWGRVSEEVGRLAETVAAELDGAEPEDGADGPRPAVRVVVKVRFAPFITVTHGQPLAEPTVAAAPIRAAALTALGRFTPGRPVRLLGVRAEFAPSS